MNVDRVLEDIAEFMALADRIATKKTRRGHSYGAVLRKTPYYDRGALAKASDDGDDGEGAGADAHGEFMSGRHTRLSYLHDKIAAAHTKLSAHYAGGAQGAHGREGDDDGEAARKFVDSFTIPASWLGNAPENSGVAQRLQQGVEQRLEEAAAQRAAVSQCLRRPLIGVPRASR